MAIIIMYLQNNIAKNKVQKPEGISRDVEKLPETGEALPAQVNKSQETRELLPGLVNTLHVAVAHLPENNQKTVHTEDNHSILNTDKPSTLKKTEDKEKHVDTSKEVVGKPEAEKTVVKEIIIEDAIGDESLPLCPEDPPKLGNFLTNIVINNLKVGLLGDIRSFRHRLFCKTI